MGIPRSGAGEQGHDAFADQSDCRRRRRGACGVPNSTRSTPASMSACACAATCSGVPEKAKRSSRSSADAGAGGLVVAGCDQLPHTRGQVVRDLNCSVVERADRVEVHRRPRAGRSPWPPDRPRRRRSPRRTRPHIVARPADPACSRVEPLPHPGTRSGFAAPPTLCSSAMRACQPDAHRAPRTDQQRRRLPHKRIAQAHAGLQRVELALEARAVSAQQRPDVPRGLPQSRDGAILATPRSRRATCPSPGPGITRAHRFRRRSRRTAGDFVGVQRERVPGVTRRTSLTVLVERAISSSAATGGWKGMTV